jgi:hypothetical protein
MPAASPAASPVVSPTESHALAVSSPANSPAESRELLLQDECLTPFHLSPTQNILFMTQLVLKLVVCAAVCYVLRQYLRPQQARGECTGGIPHGCSWVSPLGTLGGDGGFDHRMRRRDGSALMRRSCTSIFVPTPRFDREPWRGGGIFGVPGCRRQPTDGCPCVRPKESSSRSHSGLRELAHMIF